MQNEDGETCSCFQPQQKKIYPIQARNGEKRWECLKKASEEALNGVTQQETNL
ncbi:unnamed protein product [Paramecium octaurelia]|uniref:Uncharacterized protein n=1 Tax=Paramecium octaurelia TaxID=43137 RepID=A0A8S1X881_PAROT|nr:unnamed protein product [Paramecium octaurelia]